MHALVTGCAGFIGSHLTESLLGDGHDVIGVDCFNANYGRRLKLGNLRRSQAWDNFSFVPFDLSRGDLDDLVQETEVIFHLAAEPGVRASWGSRFEAYVRNNVLATQHLLESAAAHSGRRFVYASSSSVYGEALSFPTSEKALPTPYSPYGVTKLAAEHLALSYAANHDIDCVALRYFSVYGPRQRPDMAFRAFCEAALAGQPLRIYGSGTQTRDFTYIDDIVRATRSAGITPDVNGQVFNIGGGSNVALNDTLEIIAELAGGSLDVERTSAQTGDVRDTSADITLAGRRLGYHPSVPLSEGLQAQWDWVVANGESQSRI